MRKKKIEANTTWVQFKVRVPESVRKQFNEEARKLGYKNNDDYFLDLWAIHDGHYRKLLKQKQIAIVKEIKK